MRWGSLAVLVAALAFATSSSDAAEPSALELEFVTTASAPVYMTAPPGDTSRLFIVQQGSGTSALIRVMVDGAPATTFLDVTSISTGGERGLLLDGFRPGLRDDPEVLRLLHENRRGDDRGRIPA